MANRMTRKKALRRRRIFLGSCIGVLAVIVAGIILLVSSLTSKEPETVQPSSTPQNTSSVQKEEPVHEVTTATVVNTGDILIHNPVLWGAERAGGKYDFNSMFSKVSDRFKEADLAVINLEVTLGGNNGREYTGYPAFNTPDVLIDTLKKQDIGLFLTANNHCYDTGLDGMIRTAQVLKEKGMPFIGTRTTADDPTFVIQNVNDIQIGMACFTYETPAPGGQATHKSKYLNGNRVSDDGKELVNSFSYDFIDEFYTAAEETVAAMRDGGADAIVFYMHWGEEYQLQPNTWQKTIAQKLCDMGVDVIVGGHPHVIQPMELLHASGSDHTTVCLYSMGNSVSNQRKEQMTGCCETGHTEDGVLFYYTFTKDSDGTTTLTGVDAVPMWVGMEKSGYKNGIYTARYTVYPLDNETAGADRFGLSGSNATSAQNSYQRTRNLLQEGLSQCQTALGCELRWPEVTP